MNTLKQHAISILLIVAVVAVTGLNHYTTKANTDTLLSAVAQTEKDAEYTRLINETQILLAIKDQQTDRLTKVAESESLRAARAEGAFEELAQRFVVQRQQLNAAMMEIHGLHEILSVLGAHLKECHNLLREAGIQPPPGIEFEETPASETPASETPAPK